MLHVGNDVSILLRTAKAYGLQSPLRRAIDLAAVCRGAFATKERVGLSKAVEMLGLAFDGVAHGALPDARNTAHVHAELLRRLRSQHSEEKVLIASRQVDGVPSVLAQKLSACLRDP